MLGVVRGGTGVASGISTSPLRFNVLFTAVLLVALERFSKDPGTLVDLIHLQEQPSKGGPKTALECMRRAIWRMLYADDACFVPRSPRGLGNIMAVFVEVFGPFGLTNLGEQDGDHVHVDSACIGNKDSLRRHMATISSDNLLYLFGRHRDGNPKPVR